MSKTYENWKAVTEADFVSLFIGIHHQAAAGHEKKQIRKSPGVLPPATYFSLSRP